jgi:hypothetical protein
VIDDEKEEAGAQNLRRTIADGHARYGPTTTPAMWCLERHWGRGWRHKSVCMPR